MERNDILKEIVIVFIASIILAFTIAYSNFSLIAYAITFFVVIIGLNVIVKKIVAYNFESDVKINFWSVYRYGFRKDSHFKKHIPMLWLPLLLSFITRSLFWWLAILEFDVAPRTERVSRRHGLYRFTEMTEWHIAVIAAFGIAANLLLAIIGYFIAGWIPYGEVFVKLNIYFAFWSIIPLSNLDGSKILFGSKVLWFTMLIITAIFLGWSLVII